MGWGAYASLLPAQTAEQHDQFQPSDA